MLASDTTHQQGTEPHAPVGVQLGGDPGARACKLAPHAQQPERVQAVDQGRAHAAEGVAVVACTGIFTRSGKPHVKPTPQTAPQWISARNHHLLIR